MCTAYQIAEFLCIVVIIVIYIMIRRRKKRAQFIALTMIECGRSSKDMNDQRRLAGGNVNQVAQCSVSMKRSIISSFLLKDRIATNLITNLISFYSQFMNQSNLHSTK